MMSKSSKLCCTAQLSALAFTGRDLADGQGKRPVQYSVKLAVLAIPACSLDYNLDTARQAPSPQQLQLDVRVIFT